MATAADLMRDERLEAAIEAKRQELLTARTREERMAAWHGMRGLIEARSPGQVWRLEVQKGLRPAGGV